MAIVDVSGLNPNIRKAKGSSAGIIIDQLAILKNELGRDGFLSAGDYDLLIAEARKIRNGPSLTASQRSDMDVRISTFETEKAVVAIKRAGDTTRIGNTLENERREAAMVVGNIPSDYLGGRFDSYQATLNDLADAIRRGEVAGDDVSEEYNEYNQRIEEFAQIAAARDAQNSFDGKKPIPGYVAFVSTNPMGEITDVDYLPYGAKSGYVETNGMIDGFQVFGKVNQKVDGKNVFILGNQKFSGADIMEPAPGNPGSLKPVRLVAESMQTGTGFKRGEQGFLNVPGVSLKVQSYIPKNSWAQGLNGTWYKRRDDGGYTKYLNFTPDEEPKDYLRVPSSIEQMILGNVNETVDTTQSIMPDDNFVPPPSAPEGEPPAGPSVPSEFVGPLPRGTTRRTPQQPTSRSPQTPGGLAQRTFNAASSFLQGVLKS